MIAHIGGIASVLIAWYLANPGTPITLTQQKKYVRICDVLALLSTVCYYIGKLMDSLPYYTQLDSFAYKAVFLVSFSAGTLVRFSPVLVAWFMTRYCYRNDVKKAREEHRTAE